MLQRWAVPSAMILHKCPPFYTNLSTCRNEYHLHLFKNISKRLSDHDSLPQYNCPQLQACTQPSHRRASAGLDPLTSVTVLDGQSLWQNLETHPAQAPGRGQRGLCQEQRGWPGQSGQSRMGWMERHGESCPENKPSAVFFGGRQADKTNNDRTFGVEVGLA